MIGDESLNEDDDVEEGAPAWMATFSDLATLLLTFFVLLLSFANMDIQNFRTALGSVKEAFGVQFDAVGEFEARATTPVELSPKMSQTTLKPDTLDYKAVALSSVKAFVKSKGMNRQIEVFGTPRGIVLRMKDILLFETGSNEVQESGKPMLDMIAELFSMFDGQLDILGHTDNKPIRTSRFPSNWELSTGRAVSAMRYITDVRNADVQRVRIGGYAHMRPIASNETEDGRATNRRVEFMFEYPEADKAGSRMFRIPLGGGSPRP